MKKININNYRLYLEDSYSLEHLTRIKILRKIINNTFYTIFIYPDEDLNNELRIFDVGLDFNKKTGIMIIQKVEI